MKPLETIPGAMTSIDNMVSVQPGLITQVTGTITHTILRVATILMYHYYNYCYAQLLRGTSSEETLCPKEAYENLTVTHGARV